LRPFYGITLIAHKLRSGRSDGLVFGRRADLPFDPVGLAERAATAWRKATAKPREQEEEAAAALMPITLHECRHTFASLIAAGANAAGALNAVRMLQSGAARAPVYDRA